MKKAVLYIRVSTDEQADKGYSQRYQDEVLQRYCQINSINVVAVYFEDFSAKTFKRPEFSKMLITLKKHRGIADLVLFTKWDRFGRNAGDSYGMISQLKKTGVEPQAIEQPLDMRIPESKLMLALYLAQPEVENDRRSLNVIAGMRRAQKEGRWINGAPVGYINHIDSTGKKSIRKSEPKAEIIKWFFEQVLDGRFSVESLIRQAQEKGLDRSRNNFHFMMRNPVYCGQILVKPFGSEPAQIIDGLHEPIVSKEVFYGVQDILNGYNRPRKIKLVEDNRFPARGHLLCQVCNRVLTASASKGRHSYYTYYHCSGGCKERYTTQVVHEVLFNELAKLQPHPAVAVLYAEYLNELLEKVEKQRRQDTQRVRTAIDQMEAKKKTALDFLLAGTIAADDYQLIKMECESKIIKLEGELVNSSSEKSDIKKELPVVLGHLSNLASLYIEISTPLKQQLLGSIFPEKAVFLGDQVRTARPNAVLSLIFNLDKAFSQSKTPPEGGVAEFVSQVTRPGFEPRQAEPESAVLPLYYRAFTT